MTDKNDRLREPPADRLATSLASFDLRAAAEELWREHGASGRGHRQKVLARHTSATVALFVFEPEASLAPHSVGGTVVIQCIEGELALMADATLRSIGPGELFVMAPHVRHSVQAKRRSVLLLTVALQPNVAEA